MLGSLCVCVCVCFTFPWIPNSSPRALQPHRKLHFSPDLWCVWVSAPECPCSYTARGTAFFGLIYPNWDFTRLALRCSLSQGFFPIKHPRLLVLLSISPILLENSCCQPWEAQHRLLYPPPIHDTQPQREAEAILFLHWLWVWRSRHLIASTASNRTASPPQRGQGTGTLPFWQDLHQMQSWRAVSGLDRSQPLTHPSYKNITRLPPVDDNCTRATYVSLFQNLVATVTRRFWHKEIIKEATAEPREIAVKHKLRAFYFMCTLK